MNDFLNVAMNLAEKAHQGQFRKGNGEPYINHPKRVANHLIELQKNDNRINDSMIAAAFGHDVLEDTKVTEQEILEVANEEVLRIVKELTNPSKNFVFLPEHRLLPRGGVRQLKKQMDRDHLANVSWEARVIKLVDRIDNVSDMENMDKDFCLLYADESELLLGALRGTNEGLEAKLLSAIEALRKRFD